MKATTIIAVGSLPVLWLFCLFVIRRRRQNANERTSQEQFAASVGLHAEYIAGLERAERNPSIIVLHRIADGLGLPVVELIAGQPPDALGGNRNDGRLVSCPGCDCTTDDVISALRSQQPCPICGLPAAVMAEVEAAQQRAIWSMP